MEAKYIEDAGKFAAFYVTWPAPFIQCTYFSVWNCSLRRVMLFEAKIVAKTELENLTANVQKIVLGRMKILTFSNICREWIKDTRLLSSKFSRSFSRAVRNWKVRKSLASMKWMLTFKLCCTSLLLRVASHLRSFLSITFESLSFLANSSECVFTRDIESCNCCNCRIT